MEINNIYNMDCNKGMNKMIKENQKVDLIIADPPYVISKKSQFHTMKDRKNPRNGTDFGDWDKEFNNKPWLKKSYELLNKGGSLIVFNDFKKATEIIDYAQSLGFIYKDTLIWKKTQQRRGHSPPHSKLHADRRFFLHLKGLQRAHEPLCVDVEFPFVIMHLILFPQQLDDLL